MNDAGRAFVASHAIKLHSAAASFSDPLLLALPRRPILLLLLLLLAHPSPFSSQGSYETWERGNEAGIEVSGLITILARRHRT